MLRYFERKNRATGDNKVITLETATPDDIRKILELYQQHCGGTALYEDPDAIIRSLRRGGPHDGYRVGSTWSRHSKLEFRVAKDGRITATMYENFDPKDRREDNPSYVEARQAAEAFKQAVLEL